MAQLRTPTAPRAATFAAGGLGGRGDAGALDDRGSGGAVTGTEATARCAALGVADEAKT